MREILVAGGYDEVLRTGFADRLGSDPADAQVWAALWPESAADYPPAGATAWELVSVEVIDGAGVVGLPLAAAQPVGHFRLWLKIQQDGKLWLVRVHDPDDESKPWHIWVH